MRARPFPAAVEFSKSTQIGHLGSRLIDHSRKMTIAARAKAAKKAEHDLDAAAAPVAALVISDGSLRDRRSGM